MTDPVLLRNELVALMAQLSFIVKDLAEMYEKHPELNDLYDISQAVPVSLNEWGPEIQATIEGLQKS